MRGRLSYSVFLVALLVAASAWARPSAAANAENLGVVPMPQLVEHRDGLFRIDGSTKLVLAENATADERHAAEDLAGALEKLLNVKLSITSTRSDSGSNAIVIGKPATHQRVAALMKQYGLSFSDKMKAEGYVLGVGNGGIVIGAPDEPGLLYGTMSLRQMVQTAGASLVGVKIHDWPCMKMRGVQEETAYGQVSTMENFKEIIRFIARYKMNTYFIYLEDNYRFQHSPMIGEGRGAFDADQINELEAYAKKYHIELIPIFEMLGNQGALLMLDAVRPYAEFPGSHSFATDDAAFGFLEKCFNELAEVFDSKYFHAGLDESWDLGYGKTEAEVKKYGRGTVHAKHYQRINEMFRKRGKTMIMYGDVIITHPEILELIPRDIVLMDWDYDPKPHYKSVGTLAQYGFPLMVLPGLNNWNRIFPRTSAALINIRNLTLDGIRHDAIGSFTSTWGDYGSKNLRELNYFGYAYGGEVTWSPQSSEVGSFYRRFFTLRNGPGTSVPLQAISALLEKWPFKGERPILDYFRHPFSPRFREEEGHSEQGLFRLREDARVARELIALLRPIITRRKGDLDYLDYCARSHQNYTRGQSLVRDLRDFAKSNPSKKQIEKAKKRFATEAGALRDEMYALRDTYRDLWLRTNLRANLHYPIAEYDRLALVWERAAQRASAGIFAYDPRPPSQWIYHPDSFTKKSPVQNAYFRRTLNISPETIQRAGIQLQGDTHVKLYVNGKLLGEQFARRNLSAPVNPQLVKLYDIKPYLRRGKNVIAIEAHGYGSESAELEPGGPKRCGGFHLYAEIVDLDGKTKTLISDPSWKVADRPPEDWTAPAFDDSAWKPAQGDPKPTIWVTYPDFVRGVPGFSDLR